MPTYAEFSAELLKNAAEFFKIIASENPEIQKDMTQSAAGYEALADLILAQPSGSLNGKAYSVLVAETLIETAKFFRRQGEQNAPIKDQMEMNASIYEQIAQNVQTNPLGLFE